MSTLPVVSASEVVRAFSLGSIMQLIGAKHERIFYVAALILLAGAVFESALFITEPPSLWFLTLSVVGFFFFGYVAAFVVLRVQVSNPGCSQTCLRLFCVLFYYAAIAAILLLSLVRLLSDAELEPVGPGVSAAVGSAVGVRRIWTSYADAPGGPITN